jgi:hypothetical protein
MGIVLPWGLMLETQWVQGSIRTVVLPEMVALEVTAALPRIAMKFLPLCVFSFISPIGMCFLTTPLYFHAVFNDLLFFETHLYVNNILTASLASSA